MRVHYLFIFLLSALPITCHALSPKQVRALYSSIEPHSVSQFLAFYELYPNTVEGKKALAHAWRLLSGGESSAGIQAMLTIDNHGIHAIIDLVNKPAGEDTPLLDEGELAAIDRIAYRLPNRRLKGYAAQSEEDVLKLPPEEIDLARGMLLSQFGDKKDSMSRIRSYEASLDLMALQILSKLSNNASSEDKIDALNTFIFREMRYRFPPHSQYAKDVDIYSFLPSVLDSRRGVCLGVSILYLCLAQRLDLPLEMITPPGHIYVRYRKGDKIINIETTARGVDLDSEIYLGVNTRSLQQRNIKEVIGMAHFNQASIFLQNGEFDKALAAYNRALPYQNDDKFLQELIGYSQVMSADKTDGINNLKEISDYLPDYAVSKNNMAEDYLKGHVDEEGMKAIFKSVDETRESLIEKRDLLIKSLKKYPKFRAGHFSLATTWLQLHRMSEALKELEAYHQLDDTDPTAEYYLAIIYMERMHYTKAWEHFSRAEELTKARDHNPKALIELRRQLLELAPRAYDRI
ncbi:MAG: hypothetical protein KDK72_02160 [Chlamydiia bacterium]|nr:hypothetical protein [Chlamydiia bacterium]